ncbi:MAG: hypothetical protein ACPLXM_08045 [Bacteroidales bacterium]
MNIKTNRYLFISLVAIECLLLLGYILDCLFGNPEGYLHKLLCIEDENTIQSWFSSLQLFLVSWYLFGLAFTYGKFISRKFWALFLLAAGFLFLSADEIIMVHETIGYAIMPEGARAGSRWWYSGIWGFILGPILFAFLVYLFWSLRDLFKGNMHLLWRSLAGVVIFVGAAAMMDELANLFPYKSKGQMIETVMEEGGEMLGISLILWAVLDLCTEKKIPLFPVGKGERNEGKGITE